MCDEIENNSGDRCNLEKDTDTGRQANLIKYQHMVERLSTMTSDLLGAASETEIYTIVAQTATEIFDLPVQDFLRYDAESEQFQPVAHSDAKSTSLIDTSRHDHYLYALESTSPVITHNIFDSPDVPDHNSGIQSECLIPVGDYGVFIAASPEPSGFDMRTISLARMLATNTQEALQQIDHKRQRRDYARQFRTIVNNVPIVLSAIDEEGTFRFTEGKALAHIDKEPGEPTGESVFEAYAEYKNMHDHLHAALDGEPRQFTLNFLNRVFDTWFEPIDDPETPVEVITAAIDVTERSRREELNQVLNRFLRHNLRNELNVIIINAESIAGRDSEQVTDAAEEIIKAGTRLKRLAHKARQLINVAECGSGPEAVPLYKTIQQVVEQTEQEYDISISVEPPAMSVQIEEYITSITIRELVENAAEHGAEPITVVSEVSDGNAMVTIRDEGGGLPEHEQSAVANAEQNPIKHGSSIGLFAANWVVTQAGGDLTIDDADDCTQITITAPSLSEENSHNSS